MMARARPCPLCGDQLPERLHPGAYGKFRLCSREECAAVVPESDAEWRVRLGEDLDNAQAEADRILAKLDRIDEQLRGAPQGSVKDGRSVYQKCCGECGGWHHPDARCPEARTGQRPADQGAA